MISLVYDVMLECSRSIFEPLFWLWAKNNGSCVRQHLNVQRGIHVIRNTGSVECFVTQYISKAGAIHFWGEKYYISVECDKFSDTGFEWRWRPLWSSCNKSWCHVHLVQYFSIKRYFCINVFFVPNTAQCKYSLYMCIVHLPYYFCIIVFFRSKQCIMLI